MTFQPWAQANKEPVIIDGKIAGRVMNRSFLSPVALKTLAADSISEGIVFRPPIIEKTIFQSIDKKIIKIAAPSKKLTLIKTKTIIGKNAKAWIDCKTSKKGKSIFSSFGVPVIKRAKGTEKINDKK